MFNYLEIVRDASFVIDEKKLIVTPNAKGPPPQTFGLVNFERVQLTIKHGAEKATYVWSVSTKTLRRVK